MIIIMKITSNKKEIQQVSVINILKKGDYIPEIFDLHLIQPRKAHPVSKV